MGKIVKSVLIIAAAVAIVAFAPEIAGAIGFMSGVGMAGVTAATLAAITSAVVGLGISLGLSALQTLLTKTPSMSQSLADRLALNVDTTAPRRIIFGNTAAASDLRFKETYGKNDDRLALVLALASHQVNAIKTVTLDSVLVWDSSQNGANNNDVPGNKYDDGYDFVNPIACGTAANAVALGSGNYWTRSSTFTGCAYMRIAFRMDKTKVWTNGLPQKYTTVVEGCPIYDPRLDSTNGGSGEMRPTDQTTWKYYNGAVAIGRNPALAILTYIIGYKINGVLAWGMGIPLNRINMQSFIQYANLCEEQVQAADGSNIQRFTVDGIFDTSETHETILNAICLCMGTAILTDTDGVFQFSGGYDDTLTPAFSFGPDDVISGGVWTPSEPSRNRFNRVQGRFADPTNLYTLATWGEVAVDTLADDIPRTQTVDFGAVDRAESCQRLAKQMVVKSKYGGTYTAVFGLRGFCVSVGSLCTLSGMNGWNNKLFRVVTQDETFDLTYQMTLREESPEIYEWDKSEEKPLPVGILDSIYDPVTAEAVVGLTAEAVSINGTNSVDTIYINVDWTPAQSLRTTSIEIQSQVAGSTIWSTEAERFDPTAGAFKFAAGVNGAAITVQARYHMDNGAYGAWTTVSLSSTPVSTVNQWSAVYDNGDGTKPADGATVGAQAGSNLKDSNGNTLGDGDVITSQGTSADTSHVAGIPAATVTGNISDLLTNVGDLQTTYGSTAAAATSATNAANSASSASAANTNAQTAATNAATANTAAQAAKTAATNAQTAAQSAQSDAANSKTAAAASASTAATSATNATTANTNAQSAVTAAQAAQTAALTQAGNASASATAANDSAGAASTSAGQASTSATNAAGSATAAASSATVSANNAGAAQAAASVLFPSDFTQGATFWSNTVAGNPATGITSGSFVSVSGIGEVYQGVAGTALFLYPKGLIDPVVGRRYRASASVRCVVNGSAGTSALIEWLGLNSDYNNEITQGSAGTSPGSVNNVLINVAGGWTTISADFVPSSTPNAYVRPRVNIQTTTGGQSQVAFFKIEDVTESFTATTQASAAATSASNAATSQTAAGVSATSAQTAATTATTQAGNAQTFATNASTSATNAQGFANTASTEAGVAASSASNAVQAVAQSLPTDFQNDGQFWSNSYTGAPTRQYLLPDAFHVFPTTGSYITINGATGTAVDVSNLGAMTVQAGRSYLITANYNVINLGTGGTGTSSVLLYGIYLDNNYAQTVNTSSTINLTATGSATAQRTVDGSTVLASGATMFRCLFRTSCPSARTGLVVQINNIVIEDVTESATATAQASAAATSASNAATSATNAGTSATSASASATTATTQAGNAQTFANNASTSATNAQGFANTATTQAGVSASSATTAALTAAQTLPTDFTQQGEYWFNGYQGTPSAGLATATASQVSFTTVTGLGPVALVAPAVGANVDTSMAGVLTVAPGRIYQLTVTYEGKTASSGLFVNPFIIGLNASYTYIAAGSTSVNIPISDTSLHTTTVQIHGDTVIAAGCNAIRALLRIGISAGGTAGGSAYLVSGVLEDVTSATAAATSASSAATSATNAGTSATSAQSAATTATTQAGNAQTYASNASTSATNAQGFANTATTQAGVAASSANNAIQTVAQLLPSDWQNDGQFWSRNYLGVPTRASLVATAGIIAFPTSGNYVTFTAVSSITADIAALGAITIAPGRTYRTTANWSVVSLGSGAAVRVETFCVGLTADYLTNVYTPSNTPAAPTATGAQTSIVVIVNGDAAIAAGAAMLRPVFRVNSAGVVNTGFSVQINSFIFEDITESTAATTQASAAAGSASSASTSATNAGTSATAAAASATSASTSAGSASTFASNASTSATNAAGSATSAATQAGVSATSATAAQSAQASAELSAAMGFPSQMDAASTYYYRPTGSGTTAAGYAGDPALKSMDATGLALLVNEPSYGWVYKYPITALTNSSNYLAPQGIAYCIPGKCYEVTATWEVTTYAAPPFLLYLWMLPLDSTYTNIGGNPAVNVSVTATGTYTAKYRCSDSVANGASSAGWVWVANQAYFRPMMGVINNNGSDAGSVIYFKSLTVVDVTALVDAEQQATAAATSASNAAISATNAGASASSAQSSATTAATQAGNAQTFANNASTSATNASGSANTASTASGAASTSATNAANSATAAGTSATTAATQATNASNSATAANTSAINASSPS